MNIPLVPTIVLPRMSAGELIAVVFRLKTSFRAAKDILDYGDDIETPEQWRGETRGGWPTRTRRKSANVDTEVDTDIEMINKIKETFGLTNVETAAILGMSKQAVTNVLSKARGLTPMQRFRGIEKLGYALTRDTILMILGAPQ